MFIFKKIVKLFLNEVIIQKIVSYLLLILFFFLFNDFLFIFFLTFIFSYLFFTFWKFLKVKLDLFLDKFLGNKNISKIIKKIFSLDILIFFLYIFFIWFLVYTIIDLPPKLTHELQWISKEIPALKEPLNIINTKIEQIKNINTELWKNINEIITQKDIDVVLQIFNKIKFFWIIFFKVIIALILSYIFIIDREKLSLYLKTIEKSNFWFLYTEYKNILKKIVKTFWRAFKAQSFIALVNSILTTIWLLLIWFFNLGQTFPFIYTLALIVFICWFIPFIWLIISSIPIFIVWYTMVWWFSVIFQILWLLIIIHLIEAYYLNPKIVSIMIHLPISLTFLVLLISEHFLGFAWLILWTWIFYFLLELLKDTDKIITKSKTALFEMKEVEFQTKKCIKNNIRLSRKIEE